MTITSYQQLMTPIRQFLLCETPDAWVEQAKQPENLPILLIDHMICELKAAQTAMWLIRKYAVDKTSGDLLLNWLLPYEQFIYCKKGSLAQLADVSVGLSKKITVRDDCPYGSDLVDKMVLLIKEELHHFYQVLEILVERNIPYQNITAGRYAKGLMQQVRTHEPATLIDKLICGAYIEARSCERFFKLAPHVDAQLEKFYISLLRSEARHYQDYLQLAEQIHGGDLSDRIEVIGKAEAALITTPDRDFRFHSGVPV